MNQKFEWQAEDSEEWPFSAEENDQKDQQRTNQRRLIYGAVLLVFLTFAFFSFQEIEQFVGETGVEIEQEVASSSELVFEAARLADPEILASLISGSDQVWAEAQLSIVASGNMFERIPYGFKLRNDSVDIEEIAVSPELDRAEVIVELGYDIISMAPASEAIYLEQDLHFRRSGDRWLMAPPRSDYWGSSVVDEGYYLTIRYPERDAIIGNRLALDLEALIASFCYLEPKSNCTTRMPIRINLVTNPISISETRNKAKASDADSVLELPSPSLFGFPGSENAYKALYRSYGERLVDYLMVIESDYMCCDGRLFYEALLSIRLNQLDLAYKPSGSGLEYSVVSNPLVLGESLWQTGYISERDIDPSNSVLASTLVNYITRRWNDVPLTTLQRNLSNTTTFGDWINSTIAKGSMEDFNSGWQQYLLNQAPF